MKTIIFGVGNYYQEQKDKLKEYPQMEVIALADNNSALWGDRIDDFPVISPNSIGLYMYDYILIMSTYICPIYQQLINLGIERNKIIIWRSFLAEQKQGQIAMFPSLQNKKQGKWKILIISQELNYDGGSMAALYAAMALNDRGLSVVIAAPCGNPKLIQEGIEKGITFACCPTLPYIFDSEKNWIKQFDVVIVNLFTMVECAYEVNKIRPTVWWIHESSFIYKTVMVKFLSCMNKVQMSNICTYAVSKIAQHNFNYEFESSIKSILTIGIPDRAAAEIKLNKEKHKKDKKTVFAIIGMVYSLKSQDIFLQAASMVSASLQAEFWIIGKLPDNDYCKKVKEMAAGMRNVKLLGELTRDEICDAYQEIDAVVCASQEETLSMAIIEAMMFAKVCITTNNTGVASYIQNGINGFVVPVNDALMLSEKMQWVIENGNEADRMGQAARKTYDRYFKIDILGENLENVLNETFSRWQRARAEAQDRLCGDY